MKNQNYLDEAIRAYKKEIKDIPFESARFKSASRSKKIAILMADIENDLNHNMDKIMDIVWNRAAQKAAKINIARCAYALKMKMVEKLRESGKFVIVDENYKIQNRQHHREGHELICQTAAKSYWLIKN